MKSQCCYTRHPCSRFRYRDYRFCFQHILEDKSAPFMSCQYISNTTNRRCHNPALKTDDSDSTITLCEVHQQQNSSIAGQVNRKRSKKSSHLSRLESSPSGKRKKFKKSKYERSHATFDSPDSKSDLGGDDSYEFDADVNSRWLTARTPNWKVGEPGIDADSSEDDANPLKNAGIYTLEEIASNSKHCLVKLQSLYVKQFGQLNRKLQAKRRQYLLNQDHVPAQNSSEKPSAEDTEAKTELEALLGYRRHSKTSLLLHQQAKRRRIEASKGSATTHDTATNKVRCGYVSNHIRCKNTGLPYTKYCLAHILEDPLQMLYKKCSFEPCKTPVCLLPYAVKCKSEDIPSTFFCPLHEPLRPINEDLLASMKEIEAFQVKRPLNATSKEAVSLVPEEQSNISTNKPEEEPGIAAEKSFVQRSEASNTEPPPSTIVSPESVSDELSSLAEEKAKRPLLTIDEDQLRPEMSQSDQNLLQDISQTEEQPEDTSSKMDVSKPEAFDLPTSDIAHLKTGQCYVLSQVSICDNKDPSNTSALQLQPVGCNTQTLLVKTLPQVQTTQGNSSGHPAQPRAVLDVNPDGTKSSSSTAELHHHGTIITVGNLPSPNLEDPIKQGSRKVSSSATLVPPIEIASSSPTENDRIDATTGSSQTTHDANSEAALLCSEKPDSNKMMEVLRLSMPPTEPIVSGCVAASESTEDHTPDDVATPKKERCENNQSTSLSGTNTIPTPLSADTDISPQEAVTSNELPSSANQVLAGASAAENPTKGPSTLRQEESKSLGMPLLAPLPSQAVPSHEMSPGGSLDSQASNHDSLPPLTEDNPNATSPAARDTSENTSPSEGDRKPSSADEETAVASLLSLCSGALPSDS